MPVIVLCRPQIGENIGAAARAAMNGGIDEMRIVSARKGAYPSDAATAMGAGALDKMHIEEFQKLDDAIADCHQVFAFTARTRDVAKQCMTPKQAVENARGKTAFVFGAEREGLTNNEISRAQTIVHIPVNDAFSSLNLAQAVMVLSYEWMQNQNQSKENAAPDLAQQNELEALFVRLEDALEKGEFFRSPDMRPTMVRNIRAMLTRAEFSSQEARTMHGIITALTGSSWTN